MSRSPMAALFAQSAASAFPAGKALGIIVLFGAAAAVSAAGLFASADTLESMAGVIGTKNPLIARIACGIGLVVGLGGVAVGTLALLGKL